MKAIKLSRLGSLNHLWVVFQVQSTEETNSLYFSTQPASVLWMTCRLFEVRYYYFCVLLLRRYWECFVICFSSSLSVLSTFTSKIQIMICLCHKPNQKKINHLKSEQSILGLMSQVLELVLGVCSPKDLGVFLCGPLDNYSYWTTVLLPISIVGKLHFKRVPPMLQSPPRWKNAGTDVSCYISYVLFLHSIYLPSCLKSFPTWMCTWLRNGSSFGACWVHAYAVNVFTLQLWGCKEKWGFV